MDDAARVAIATVATTPTDVERVDFVLFSDVARDLFAAALVERER